MLLPGKYFFGITKLIYDFRPVSQSDSKSSSNKQNKRESEIEKKESFKQKKMILRSKNKKIFDKRWMTKKGKQ